MKNIILALLLCLCGAPFSFGQFRMVGNVSGSWTSVNDSTYTGTVNFQSDLTGQGYLATAIADTFRLFTPTEQMYRVDSVWNKTFSSASMRLVRTNGAGAPVGQVLVFDPNGRTTIPQNPFGSTGATAQLNAAVDAWNARQITSTPPDGNGIYGGSGTMLQDTTVVTAKTEGTGLLRFDNFGAVQSENLQVQPNDQAHLYNVPSLPLGTRTWANSYVIKDDYLYMTGGFGSDSLYVYDISDRSTFRRLQTYKLTGWSVNTQQYHIGRGSKIYAMSGGLVELDVSEKDTVTYKINNAFNAFNYDVKDTILAIIPDPLSGRILRLFNIGNFTSPVLLDTFDFATVGVNDNNGFRCEIEGNNLYAFKNNAANDLRAFKFDINNLTDIKLVNADTLPAQFIHFARSGNVFYFLDNTSLRVYEYNDTLVLLSTLNVALSLSSPAVKSQLQGDFLYVAEISGTIAIFNVANPRNPFLLKRITSPATNLRPIEVEGSRLVVGSRTDGAGLYVYDIGGLSANFVKAGDVDVDAVKTADLEVNRSVKTPYKNAEIVRTDESGTLLPGTDKNGIYGGNGNVPPNTIATAQGLFRIISSNGGSAKSTFQHSNLQSVAAAIAHENPADATDFGGLAANYSTNTILRSGKTGTLRIYTPEFLNETFEHPLGAPLITISGNKDVEFARTSFAENFVQFSKTVDPFVGIPDTITPGGLQNSSQTLNNWQKILTAGNEMLEWDTIGNEDYITFLPESLDSALAEVTYSLVFKHTANDYAILQVWNINNNELQDPAGSKIVSTVEDRFTTVTHSYKTWLKDGDALALRATSEEGVLLFYNKLFSVKILRQ